MISFLRGVLENKTVGQVEIDVGGIGYQVLVPTSTFQKLPVKGKEIKIYTYESVGMYGGGTTVYGFLSQEEREIFILLRSISKIGTKGALDIVSKISKSFPDFKHAILKKDAKVLISIFGLTKKTAEKLILGLKDKINEFTFKGERKILIKDKQQMLDAISGLVALGYRESESKEAVNTVCQNLPKNSRAEEIIKGALKFLRR